MTKNKFLIKPVWNSAREAFLVVTLLVIASIFVYIGICVVQALYLGLTPLYLAIYHYYVGLVCSYPPDVTPQWLGEYHRATWLRFFEAAAGQVAFVASSLALYYVKRYCPRKKAEAGT